MQRRSGAVAVSPQPVGDHQEIVGQHGGAHQQLEVLAPSTTARFMPRPRSSTEMRPSMAARPT